MPACKRNQFAIRYDPGNSGLAWYPHDVEERQRAWPSGCYLSDLENGRANPPDRDFQWASELFATRASFNSDVTTCRLSGIVSKLISDVSRRAREKERERDEREERERFVNVGFHNLVPAETEAIVLRAILSPRKRFKLAPCFSSHIIIPDLFVLSNLRIL